MGWKHAARLIPLRGGQRRFHVHRPTTPAMVAAVMGLALLLTALLGIAPVQGAQAAPDMGVSPSATCETLAGLAPTATNGKSWGRTVLPGHNAPGGWFGVDVCDNGLSASTPNGANVSCDRVPANWIKTGCAPGRATSDGYGLTFQCVELIIRFSAWAYGDRVGDWGRSGYGNAPDLWLPQNHPSDFVMYPNGSDHAPVPGDILVWGNVDAQGRPLPAGTDGEHGGHIAVVAAVRNGVVITAEQNVKWGSDDHPSDTMALTKVGSHWILSGSNQHETHLPTYRWRRTMGNSRATYGWLHSVKNHGTFPSTTTHVARPAPTPPANPSAPTQMSGGLPSLAGAAVITKDGTLADLVWSQTSPFAAADTQAPPHAELRSLGAPPNAHLTAGQLPALVQLSDGSRYSYVVATDGHVYAARTSPGILGVWWIDLGMPGAIQLVGSAAASAYAGGVAVAAVGSDGNLWWRAGPAASPGGWQLIGHPGTTALAGSFAVAGAPGNGSPLLLALGVDGRLYERLWQPALLNSDGSVQVPATWSEWITIRSQPAGVQLTGRLVVAPETVNPRAWVGSWPDTPLDVLMSDSTGKVWWLRSTAFSSGWVLNTVPLAAPVSTLVAGAVTPIQPASGAARPVPASSRATAELALYAMTAKAPYEAQIAIPAHPHDLIAAPTWTRLSSLPAGMTTGTVGVALPLGASESSLLVPQASSVLVGGITSATSMLISFDSSTVSVTGESTNTWLELGAVATAPAFSDPLDTTSANPGWVAIGDGTTATDSTAGLRLVPGSSGSAALLQGALPGDASATVRVSLPNAGSGVHAGLMLYLDGGSWLTLAIGQDKRVVLCVETQAKALPCVSRTAMLPASARFVWLRVTRQAATFTGAYSADAQAWSDVGQWIAGASSDHASGSGSATASATPFTPAPPTATIAATPAAAVGTPSPAQVTSSVAPLGFTEWGVFIAAGPGVLNVPLFKSFDVTTALPSS
ncbi:MAG TPA: CHAP domain-containing protein [Ktedonobacterales bacterium]|nr:CHAP domain-containing protein [Ktedonobacterales bacterium]